MIHLNPFPLLLALGCLCWQAQIVSGRTNERELDSSPQCGEGEYGHRLDLLRRCYTGPKEKGESNHFIDMCGGENLREFAFANGLTNNNALFVISHGKGIFASSGRRYAYYPDKSLLADGKTPYFSAKDLAETLGPAGAKQIHNLVIAGCNAEGVFSADELRHYFVNATNVMHTPAKHDGHDRIFRHTLVHQSSDIQFLYATPGTFTAGKFNDTRSNKQLSPYMARLYRPGEAKPFRTQIAGRELLEPAKAPDIKAASVVAEVASAPEAAEDALVFAADSAAPVAHSTEPLIIRGEKTRPIRHDGFIERISNATFPFPSDQPGFFGRTATALRTVCVAVLTGALAAYWIVLFKRASKTRRARTVAANRTGSEADPLSARLSARWSEDIVPLKLKTSDPRAEAVVKGINRRR